MSQSNSSDAYRSSQKLGAEARQTEARALLETARALSEARDNFDDAGDFYKAMRNCRKLLRYEEEVLKNVAE